MTEVNDEQIYALAQKLYEADIELHFLANRLSHKILDLGTDTTRARSIVYNAVRSGGSLNYEMLGLDPSKFDSEGMNLYKKHRMLGIELGSLLIDNFPDLEEFDAERVGINISDRKGSKFKYFVLFGKKIYEKRIDVYIGQNGEIVSKEEVNLDQQKKV